MNLITVTATKRITRRKFGHAGPVIVIASKGDTISVNVCDTRMPDDTVQRSFTVYPEGMSMGYGLTASEITYDAADADANATIARQYAGGTIRI